MKIRIELFRHLLVSQRARRSQRLWHWDIQSIGPNILVSVIVSVGFCAFSANPGFALSYSFAQVDVPGAMFTEATGINNLDQIVGTYTDSANHQHGFVYDGSNFTTIDFPGGDGTNGFGINDSGEVVGTFGDSEGTFGFLKSGTSFAPISVQGSIATQALGINGAGDIVGSSANSNVTTAFDDTAGSIASFNVTGALFTEAHAVNQLGEIVGRFSTKDNVGSQSQGFLDDAGSFATVVPPGSVFTVVDGINDLGEMVGGFVDGSGASHGFLFAHATFTTFDVPATFGTQQSSFGSNAIGINNAGVVVGNFGNSSGVHGFIAEPTPQFLVAPASVDFGNVGTSTSAVRTVKITNSATKALSGTVDESGLVPPFGVNSGAGRFTIAPLRAKTIRIGFAPTSEGTFSGSITVIGDSGSGSVSVSVTGAGVPGSLAILTPTPMGFGSVKVRTRKSLPLTFMNAGLGVLQGRVDATELEPPFTSLGTGRFALRSGQRRTVTVKFVPTSTGSFSTYVTILTYAPANGEVEIGIKGSSQ